MRHLFKEHLINDLLEQDVKYLICNAIIRRYLH